MLGGAAAIIKANALKLLAMALCAAAVLLVLAWDRADDAEAERDAAKAELVAMRSAAKAREVGASRAAEIVEVTHRVEREVIREIASARPFSEDCRAEPAWRAAIDGDRRMRDAYLSSLPAARKPPAAVRVAAD